MRGTTTYETTINCLDDEYDVPVMLDLRINGDECEITKITRMDRGIELIVSSDIMTELGEAVHSNWDQIIGDAEAAYADYRYEQYKDERDMEL